MATETRGLAGEIEAIAAEYGVDLTTTTKGGFVWTTPGIYDWPDEMYDRVKEIAALRHGPDSDFWEAR